MSVLIFVDGVMRRPNNTPVNEGLRLYKHLADKERVILLCNDKEDCDRWIKQNNLASKLDDIIDYDQPGLDEFERKLRQVQYCKSRGPVEYVISDDIELAKTLLEQGYAVYLFLSPKYFSHKFRPDRPAGVKAWNDIVNELDRQQQLYDQDRRIKYNQGVWMDSENSED